MTQYGADVPESGPARALADYLGCPCRYFPPMEDGAPIREALAAAVRARDGFTPVLAAVDDVLLECLAYNAGPGSGGEIGAVDPEKLAACRREILARPVPDGGAVLDAIRAEYGGGCADPGRMAGGQAVDSLAGIWDYAGGTVPLLLALVPVERPWEVFAYLPFGGWNECPGTEQQMAVAKRWYERFGAVPAAVTHDTLEFTVPAPVPAEQAMELAGEQYIFCCDIVDQGPEGYTVGALADTLRQSTVWFFWWD